MNQETKNEYLNLISELGEDLPALQVLRNFINTYEGPDTPELHQLFLVLIDLSIDHDLASTKARFYDELEDIRDETQEEYDKVREEEEEEEGIDMDDLIVPVIDSDTEEKKDASQ